MGKAVDATVKNSLPLISVIFPVYNAELYLKESVESILNQTLTNFELLIYNDASTDNSDEIIRSTNDKRIIYECMENHTGYVVLLNKGLARAKGRYIARMDADDISLPERFEEQISFLDEHTEVGICGTWYNFFGGMSGLQKTPCTSDEVQLSLFYGTPFGHPTVMMRKELLEKYKLTYNNDFLYAEDYEFFERASMFFPIINIPKSLLEYRKHSSQVTNTKWQLQYFLAAKIQARRLLRALNNNEEGDKTWLENYFTENSVPTESWFNEINQYKEKLIRENNCYKIYSPQLFTEAVDTLFTEQKTKKNIYNYCFRKFYNQQRFNLPLLVSFFKDEIKPYKWLGSKLTCMFILKCLINYRKKSVLPI